MKLTALFLLLPALLYAQNTLEGQWTGTLNEGSRANKKGNRFELYLTVEGGVIGGTSTLYTKKDSTIKQRLRGRLTGERSLSLQEVNEGQYEQAAQQYGLPDSAFLRQYQLIFARGMYEPELNGYWQQRVPDSRLVRQKRGQVYLKRQPAPSEASPKAPYLQYGERYYRNSYSGLSRLMKELPAQDPELHGRLYPRWKQMRANQGWGIAAGVAGIIGGALIMLSPTADNTGITTLDPNARLRRVAWGAIVLGAGISGSFSLINRREEVLKFINIFNAVSEGTKLQFSLTDSAGPGLGLIYRLY